MTTQSFKSVVRKSGSRVFIALPFNPNDVWGIKQRHYVTGTASGHGVRGSLGSDGWQYFLPLRAACRRDCGIAVGNTVEVVISPESPQSQALAPAVNSRQVETSAGVSYDE